MGKISLLRAIYSSLTGYNVLNITCWHNHFNKPLLDGSKIANLLERNNHIEVDSNKIIYFNFC